MASTTIGGSSNRSTAAPSTNNRTDASQPPYPPSPVIAGIEWAPAASLVRLSTGSDNWPLTWAADDRLYTAYGDGRGFEPFVPRKLSMGLCRVAGSPPDIRGELTLWAQEREIDID